MTTLDIVPNSPVVIAEREARERILRRIMPQVIDLRDYINYDTAPLPLIRYSLTQRREATGLPDARFLGEDFERGVYRDYYGIYEGRNRLSGIEAFAEAAGFIFTVRWFDQLDTSGTPVREVDLPEGSWVQNYDLCVSPLPGVTPDHHYVEQITNWVRGIIPHFPHSTVTICTNAFIEHKMHIHHGIVDFQEAVAV